MKKQIAIYSAFSLTALSPLATAATITWDGGGANNIWDTPDNWDNDLAPSAGNDYVVDNALVRSTDATNNTFAGGSLTVQNGGTLQLFRTNGGGYFNNNYSIPSLTINNSRLLAQSSVGSLGQTVLTDIQFLGASTIDMRENSNFTMRLFLNGTITGSGSLDILRDTTGSERTITLGGNTSGYSGEISISGLASELFSLNLDNSTGWGTGILNIGNYGILNFNADVDLISSIINYSTTGSTLNLGSVTNTNTVGGLNIAGNSVGAGTYSASDLTALGFGGTYLGDGTITVVPEPSSSMLLGLCGIAFLLRRKK